MSKNRMNDLMACAATLLILLTTLVDPYLSAGLALALLAGFALYTIYWTHKPPVNH
jgi:hypothetical protein